MFACLAISSWRWLWALCDASWLFSSFSFNCWTENTFYNYLIWIISYIRVCLCLILCLMSYVSFTKNSLYFFTSCNKIIKHINTSFSSCLRISVHSFSVVVRAFLIADNCWRSKMTFCSAFILICMYCFLLWLASVFSSFI